jgi:hypothetical protein
VCLDDPTPKFLDVTFAGIAACADCFGKYKWTTATNPNPNATWRLVQASACSWYYECEATGVLTRYADGSCTEPGTDLNVVGFYVSVAATLGGVSLEAGYITDMGDCGMPEPQTVIINVFQWYWELPITWTPPEHNTNPCFPQDTSDGVDGRPACGNDASACFVQGYEGGTALVEIP